MCGAAEGPVVCVQHLSASELARERVCPWAGRHKSSPAAGPSHHCMPHSQVRAPGAGAGTASPPAQPSVAWLRNTYELHGAPAMRVTASVVRSAVL